MGEVVFLAGYRRRDPASSLPAPPRAADADNLPAPRMPGDVRGACDDLQTGVDRMKLAVRMLSEASAALRTLAQEQ